MTDDKETGGGAYPVHLKQAGKVVPGAIVGDRGALQTDLRRAAREIANAAAAVQSMARTIERQPNSLIRGR